MKINPNTLPKIIPTTNRMTNLTNQRFGKWYVIGFIGTNSSEKAMWLCRCDCGNYATAQAGNLVQGTTTNCGCVSRKIHGMSGTPEHRAWIAIHSRCTNKQTKGFTNWGGRGISICARWEKFENFFADMGKRPSPKHSLDRVDNDGDYCPENCRWATTAQQASNRRSNHLITWRGETHNLIEWAGIVGINSKTICKRLNRGWTVEKALTPPVRK